ncbi:hypothetical protein BX666DRAFT_1868044 [Dichotomocladium elegans]|nr:hypothetical protein BX666DRAFT_1868044 [Dichotomocladium elegans]
MGAEKKRPRGLAAQKAAKKAKVEEEPSSGNAQTVVIDKIVEEGDEIGEAAALFESALEKAGKYDTVCMEWDPDAALQLVRGTINESDRILRNWQGEERPPPAFYLTYGSALYELGRMTEDDDFTPYLDAAEERLQDGLDRFEALSDKSGHAETANKLRVALAKVWLSKAASDVSDASADVPELAIKALDTLDQVVATEDVVKSIGGNVLVEIASIVQGHGDLYANHQSQSKFRDWAEKLLLQIVKLEPENTRAFSELGACKLSLANSYLELADANHEDEDENEKEGLDEEEKKAYKSFLEAKEYFTKAFELAKQSDQVIPQLHTELAEVCLNEANLVEDESAQLGLYREAVDHIQQAKKVAEGLNLENYDIPEGLQNFLEEWEQNDE